MKVIMWSTIALAVSTSQIQFASAAAYVTDQAEAKGFIDDSKLDLLMRSYYFNRNKKTVRSTIKTGPEPCRASIALALLKEQ